MIKHVSPVLFHICNHVWTKHFWSRFFRESYNIVLGKNIPFLFIENIYVSQKNKFPRKRLNNASLLFGQWSSIRGYRSG